LLAINLTLEGKIKKIVVSGDSSDRVDSGDSGEGADC
jgi:hypothetical protein